MTTTAHAAAVGEPLPVVRAAVRRVLEATPAYAELTPDERRRMARAMVAVCQTAATLVREEMESEGDIAASLGADEEEGGAPVLAAAQASAGKEFSGVSADKVAGTTQKILNAVSFPRFVTELINGVFKAIIDSNQTQLHQYVELLNNVAASTEGFADANLGPDRARMWLVERFPGSYEIEGRDPDYEPDPDEPPPEARVRLRPGASAPSEAALRTALGVAEGESIPTGDPDRVLVPFARRALAKQRQEMLATLVQMGMQRIVIESGRITAAMRFHIDTRSAAEADTASRFDLNNQVTAKGSFGAGPWGVSAAVQNTIGYVSTQSVRTTEEMNTDLTLTSSVELNFKSDYVPLNRLASPGQAQQVAANSRNPEFEAAREAEEKRRAAAEKGDEARRKSHADLQPMKVEQIKAPDLPAEKAGKTVDKVADKVAGEKKEEPKKAPDAKTETKPADTKKPEETKPAEKKAEPKPEEKKTEPVKK